MRNSKRTFWLAIALAMLVSIATVLRASGQPAASRQGPTQWSIQVAQVDPGNINIESSFQLAIYESLLEEIGKTKRFQRVFRDGDRTAADVRDLLVLKTTVERFAAGSETKRAVTTIGGATKLIVDSKLCTRDGQVILERTETGSVRFMGSNLKATHNLAHHVANTIKKTPLPAPASSQRKAASGSTSVTSEHRLQVDLCSAGTLQHICRVESICS